MVEQNDEKSDLKMLKHLILRLKSMCREVMLATIVLLVVVASFITYSFPQQYRSYNYSIDFYKDVLTDFGNAESSGALSAMPDDLREYTAAQKKALLDVLAAHNLGDLAAEFDARLRFQQAEYSATLAGYRDESVLSSERRLVLYEQLIAKQQLYLFGDCSKMPASYYLASEILPLFPAMLFLPAAAAFAAAFASARGTKSRSFEKLLPISKASILAADFLAGLIASLVALFLALLPATVFQLVRNGFGDLSYPVVDIVNNQLMVTTVGSYLGSLLILTVAGYCFLGAVALLVSRFSDSRVLLLLLQLLCAFTASVSMYLQLVTEWGVAEYLPLTYFSITPIIGMVTSGENMTQIDSATLPMGLLVLGFSAAVTVALAIVAEKAVPFLAAILGTGGVVKN
jgi:hypothetical protein